MNDLITTKCYEHNHGSSAAKVRVQEVISELKTTSISVCEPTRLELQTLMKISNQLPTCALYHQYTVIEVKSTKHANSFTAKE